MENPLKLLIKLPQPIEEAVAKVFLKIFPNFVTPTPSATRCSPCSASFYNPD
jgi:hypothetical protein